MGIHLDSQDGTNDYDYGEDFRRPRPRYRTTIKKENAMPEIKGLHHTSDTLRARAERLLAKAEMLDNLPAEPEPDDDGAAVIWFRKQFSSGGREYTYAAVLADGLWWTSGPQGGGTGRKWDALIQWIYENVHYGDDSPVVWAASEYHPL